MLIQTSSELMISLNSVTFKTKKKSVKPCRCVMIIIFEYMLKCKSKYAFNIHYMMRKDDHLNFVLKNKKQLRNE